MTLDWTRLKGFVADWGWAVFGVVALILSGVGIGLVWHSGWDDRAAKLCFAFAQAIIGAGMVAGVLRAAQSVGFFKGELREVIQSPETIALLTHDARAAAFSPQSASFLKDQFRSVLYSDDLEGSSIDAKQSWRDLTRGLFRRRFASLDAATLAGFDFDSLIGTTDYYYERHWREVTIDWYDAEKTAIRIVETVDARLRTADVDRVVPFTNRYDPEADDSDRWLRAYRFSEGFDLTLTTANIVRLDDGRQEIRAELPPGQAMRLTRTTEKVQRMDVDPFINYRSVCIWARPEIVVNLRAADLRFYFRSMGTKTFVPRGGGDIDGLLSGLNAQCDALCLPTQGYMIVVVKVAT